MDLTIQQKCPSCGAPIELREADRLLLCSWCGVHNFMVINGPLRFILPDRIPEHIEAENIFYAPYFRFKGNVFYCRGKQQAYKVVDTTRQALNGMNLPPSLGLRPQAMALSIVSGTDKGLFLPPAIRAKTVLEHVAQLTAINSGNRKDPFYHRAFIGETLSCIYLPLYMEKEILYDGVTNSVLGQSAPERELRNRGKGYRESWTPRFLATLCPTCGDRLSGEHDSLVLSCHNCQTLWEENRGTFQRLAWETIPSSIPESRYLPFWKIAVHTDNPPMSCMADLLEITNQPRVPRDRHRSAKLFFLLPAFKIRPSTFLRLGRSMTLAQEKIPSGNTGKIPGRYHSRELHPVTLSGLEACQAMKSVLADLSLDKHKLFPRLPEIRFHVTGRTLSFLPFADRGHDFIQEHTEVAIARPVLRYGRSL